MLTIGSIPLAASAVIAALFFNAYQRSQAITHDGTRTGPIIGYSSYCHPDQGTQIYANEAIPFTTFDGRQVYWTQGDIDCYKQRIATLSAVPSASLAPAARSGSQASSSDLIVKCAVNSKCGGTPIELRQSVCSQSTCCGLPNGKWTFYTDKNKCIADQKAFAASSSPPPVPSGSSTGNFSCLVTWPCGGQSTLLNFTDQSQCTTAQKNAIDSCNSLQATPTPQPVDYTKLLNDCLNAARDSYNQQMGVLAARGIGDSSYADAVKQLELTRSRGHLKIGAGEPLMRSPHAEKPTALSARVSCGSG